VRAKSRRSNRCSASATGSATLPFDVGRVVKRPKLKDTLAERILSEGDVFKLFAAAEQLSARHRTPIQETRARRNYVLLRLLYTAGLRVDELAHLAWRDLRERGDAGQVIACGKGGKTRVVLLPTSVWRELLSLRDGASSDADLCLAHQRWLSHHHAGAPPHVRRLLRPHLSTSGRRRTGFAMRTLPTRSSAVRPSTWCSLPSAIRRWPPPAATSMRGLPPCGANRQVRTLPASLMWSSHRGYRGCSTASVALMDHISKLVQ
jgi:integrase